MLAGAVALLLPLHWQTAVWLAAGWTVGAHVTVDGHAVDAYAAKGFRTLGVARSTIQDNLKRAAVAGLATGLKPTTTMTSAGRTGSAAGRAPVIGSVGFQTRSVTQSRLSSVCRPPRSSRVQPTWLHQKPAKAPSKRCARSARGSSSASRKC